MRCALSPTKSNKHVQVSLLMDFLTFMENLVPSDGDMGLYETKAFNYFQKNCILSHHCASFGRGLGAGCPLGPFGRYQTAALACSALRRGGTGQTTMSSFPKV